MAKRHAKPRTNFRRKLVRGEPRIIIVMPAYNAEQTLKKTYQDLPKTVHDVILVDDNSSDNTVAIAKQLGITVVQHRRNRGYGGNQKTCYTEALKRDADVVVMIHPDYQYDATLVDDLVAPILRRRFDMMFGSRIRTRKEALASGMPPIKYALNRMFCVLENVVLGANFTEYFSGMRAYSSALLQRISFERFSDDFVFDQQMMIAAYANNYRIGEINIPVRYFSESSSIQYRKGIRFLAETLIVLGQYVLYTFGIKKARIFRLQP